ncbi:MAG: UDP-N-acetylmuramoyl-tripeptide--D-alanyl-D-alanine ligase [Patescibacteria group bacterium]
MKMLARNLVLKLLTRFAKRRLNPQTKIIGITGSVGKTTAKEAAAKILASKFPVLASQKSFNSEFGVPLTLLGEDSGYSNPLKWLGILIRAELKSFSKLKAEKIILELGVDKPGDMRRLLQVIQPQTGVFLNVQPVHLESEQFAGLTEIAQEKGQLITNLPEDAYAILNVDDELVAKTETRARKITFGVNATADLRAINVSENIRGIGAELRFHETSVSLKVPILGRQNIYALLAAIAVGISNGIALKNCVAILADFHLPPGRLNLLNGIRGSKLIDGSYNANPASTVSALETLQRLETSGKKIALLGQMNELGADSEKYHREIGSRAAAIADEVIGVFGNAKLISSEARRLGKPAQFFETAASAAEYLQRKLSINDFVLIKGSQNKVRLERAVTRLLANPTDRKLLCRQEAFWQKH